MPSRSHRARERRWRRLTPLGGGLLLVALALSPVADGAPWTGAATKSASGASADLGAKVVLPHRMHIAKKPRATRQQPAARDDRRRIIEGVLFKQPAHPAKALGRAMQRAAREAEAATAPFTITIGTFNVLGSQHTAHGGDRGGFAPASVRTAQAADVVARHGVDVLGTQELQDDQLRALTARTGMQAYPGFDWGVKETDNSILWDPGKYEFVSGSHFTLTFMGRPRPQPVVKLRDRANGREFYVINTHPSAHFGVYTRERRAGEAILVGVINHLKAEGLPILVTGDMNDRELFYCNVVPQAGMSASNGGSYGGGCHPPPGPLPVDWVVGWNVDSWSGYWRDDSTVSRRISDHIFVSATAHVG